MLNLIVKVILEV